MGERGGGSYARSGDYRNGCWEDYPPTVFNAETGEVLNPAPNPHGVRFSGDIQVTFAPMPPRRPKEREPLPLEAEEPPDFDPKYDR